MNPMRGNHRTRPLFTRRLLLITGAGLLLVSATGNAQVDPRFAACAAIKDSAKRLTCFDEASTPAAPAAPVAPAASLPAVPAPIARPPVAAPATPTVAAPTPVDADDFGAETVRKKTSDESKKPQRLKAQIVGEFTGWEPGTLFTFENGQVWKYVGDKSVYYPRKDAQIYIEKSRLGAYWLSVEGLNSKARVRRIK